jgi:hypothetical protein
MLVSGPITLPLCCYTSSISKKITISSGVFYYLSVCKIVSGVKSKSLNSDRNLTCSIGRSLINIESHFLPVSSIIYLFARY